MEKHEFVMKVTAYGKTVTIAQVEDAVDIHEFLDMCRTLAIGIGYHEGSWEDGMKNVIALRLLMILPRLIWTNSWWRIK